MLSPLSPGAASEASFASQASSEAGSPGYGSPGGPGSPDLDGSGGLSTFLRKSEPDPFFHYDLQGDITSAGSPLRGRSVEWRIKGVVPLEDIMYPSLNCLPKDVLSPLGSPVTFAQRHKKSSKRHSRDNSPESLKQGSSGGISSKKKDKNKAKVQAEDYNPAEGMKWAAYLSPVKVTQAVAAAAAVNSESASLTMQQEIEKKGELFLRTRLKRNMRHNQHVREQKRQIAEAKKSNLLLNAVDHKANRARMQLMRLDDEENAEHKEEMEIAKLEGSDHLRVDEHAHLKQTPDALFAELTQSIQRKHSEMLNAQGRAGSRPGSRAGDAKQILEGAYLRQKLELKDVPGATDQEELESGVLYYRIHGELNQAEDDGSYAAKYLDDTEAVDPMVLKKRERRTRLLASLAEKRAEYHSTGAHLKRALRQQSAVDYGIDYQGDHATFNPKDPQRSYADIDRKQLQVSPIKNAPSYSKRVAQDVLLINQFERRILPEIYIKAYEKITGPFIKKMMDEEEVMSSMTSKERAKAEKRLAEEHGSHATVDMSSFGVGDEQGLSLGLSLNNFNSLERLILKENRLTAASIPTIFANICTTSVMFIDVSCNKLNGKVCSKAIAKFFKVKNVCKHLNLSKCALTCADIVTLCDGMSQRAEQALEELILLQNRIEGKGALALAAYMSRRMTPEIDPMCFARKTIGNSISSIKVLNIGWNNITSTGAIALAMAITVSTNLKNIDISANSVSDIAAQQIAAAIQHSTSLEMVNLQQNQVSSPACFVFARVLKDHPSMKVLDLSLNPLGEPGARSIFRTILAGLQCFVMMRTCTFALDTSMFNHSNPASDSPYSLDLSQPYYHSVASTLLEMMAQDPEHCKVTDAAYQDKGISKPLGLLSVNGLACEKGQTSEWKVPPVGTLQLAFQYSMKLPTISMAMTNHAIFVLQIIIVTARSEADRRNWLKLLLKDVYCTTLQAQGIIDHFVDKQVIGIGGLKRIDVMNAVWPRLLDPHHMVEFLLRNITDSTDRTNMMFGMSLDLFKFNWVNPTGRWRFNLEDDDQRTTMTKFIAINKLESDYSRLESGREDTSQMENWSNFRNVSYGGITEEDEDSEEAAAEPQEKGESERYNFKPFVIDKVFTDDLPYLGIVEFDYVSTRRPLQDAAKLEEEGVVFFQDGQDANQDTGGFEDYTEDGAADGATEDMPNPPAGNAVESTPRKRADSQSEFSNSTPRVKYADGEGREGKEGDDDRSFLHSASSSVGIGPSIVGSREVTPHTTTPGQRASRSSIAGRHLHQSRGGDSRLAGRKHPRAMIISDQEMRDFLITCELTTRERCVAPDAFFKLAYMQLAATKYYFEAKRICVILECFSRDAMIQARVTVCFFSRVWDLHNFDVVMRSLSTEAQREVVLRLGYLNIMNPLKPAMDYYIDMRFPDSRKALVYCLSTGPSEGGDQLRTEAGSDLTITDMFGSINRVLKFCLDARVIFSYGEVGERTPNVSWNLRTAAMKCFLVGTLPHLQGMQRIIYLYNKLLKENMITIGPIEQQYDVMLKRKREEAEALEAKKTSMKKRRFMQGAVKLAVSAMKEADAAGT